MFDLNTFVIVLSWIVFVYTTAVLIITNYIWYFVLNDMTRTISSRAIKTESIGFLVSAVALYSIYFGGLTCS